MPLISSHHLSSNPLLLLSPFSILSFSPILYPPSPIISPPSLLFFLLLSYPFSFSLSSFLLSSLPLSTPPLSSVTVMSPIL